MALNTSFNNVVPEEKRQEAKPTTLTVLNEKDKNTIYNLIFAEETDPEDVD